MTGDFVNGAVEGIGAVLTWKNALQLWRDREVRGVYWPSWAFFTFWGYWNMYYYPSLDQWFSFAGGAALAAGNTAWTGLAFWLWWRSR